MSDFKLIEQDEILPVRIVHNCEEVWEGDHLSQRYNYLVYEFETDAHLYTARTYLDTNEEVAIFGPFLKNASDPHRRAEAPIDERIVSYLKRRYRQIMRLDDSGYTPLG